jgi:hypothetical protein
MKIKQINLLFLLSLFFLSSLIIKAQTPTEKAFQEALQLDQDDSATRNKKLLLDSLYTKHYTPVKIEQEMFNAHHHMRSFDWQYYSGNFIFILVILIVIVGLVLSFKQFQLNSTLLSKKIKLQEEKVEIAKQIPSFTDSNMEVSKDGLKINTAVIGLMILFISILFLLLYLKYVYPIQFITE